MADRYARFAGSPPGRLVTRALRLPRPVALERDELGGPLVGGPVLIGAAPGGSLADRAAAALGEAGVTVSDRPVAGGVKALVFDASGITCSQELVELQRFFHPNVAHLDECGRVVVLGVSPLHAGSPRAVTAQRALEGFTRSLGKELGGRGVTVQLLYLSPEADDELAGSLRFFLSSRSAFVSGQVIRIAPPTASSPEGDREPSLHDSVALVTGAARGIGASIARTLARDGAQVVGLDVPANREELEQLTSAIGGEAMVLDIAAPEAPQLIAKRFSDGLGVLVHNAGVTRDRTIAKMPAERWQQLMLVNLTAQEQITEALLQRGLIGAHGRVVCISSMSGIAGNAGQTNYATSKAGVIGMVQALAPQLAGHGATINAVAPGFIETAMTGAMPFAIREAGRRMSSLCQGGLPVDVAETVAWLASPASGGINGNVIRVCGQNFLGA